MKMQEFKDVTSDAMMTLLCFSGLAAHETVKLRAPVPTVDGENQIVFVNSFDWLSEFEVRGCSDIFDNVAYL